MGTPAFKNILFVLFLTPMLCMGQELQFADNGRLLDSLLHAHPEHFSGVLENWANHEVQIIYTRITRQTSGNPEFEHFRLGESPDKWFAPASLVKFPVALLTLEKLQEYAPLGVSLDTRMETREGYACQRARYRDETSPTGYPFIGHDLRKIFLVSDNDAYTRLFEFLGQQRIYERLQEMGYLNARILRRFSPCDQEENRYSSPICFLDENGNAICFQPRMFAGKQYPPPLGAVRKGDFHENDAGDIVPGPFDFTFRNFIPLRDLHQMLIGVIFPEACPPDRRFRISEEHRQFLLRTMSELPRESGIAAYQKEKYHDSYVKYLLFGDTKDPIPDHIRIYNKVGQSFGYLSDVAYIRDEQHDIEFFLSAVIYANENRTMNDGDYEYDEVSMPFLGNLGRVIYDYERSRSK